ncbi:MAG: hypothetical protein V7K32_08565 [Nostoc sp.]
MKAPLTYPRKLAEVLLPRSQFLSEEQLEAVAGRSLTETLAIISDPALLSLTVLGGGSTTPTPY